MNLHKLYLSILVFAAILVVIAGSAWRDHVRDDARRDALMETQKTDIKDLEQRISSGRSQAESQIGILERQRQSLAAVPSRAQQVIRELIPMQSPIQPVPTSIAGANPPPDAPVPQRGMTKQQELDLAQYALTCKECSVARDQLEQQSKDQQEIISRQKLELDATRKASKGGSMWQRIVRIAKWGAIFGGIGYAVGKAQR